MEDNGEMDVERTLDIKKNYYNILSKNEIEAEKKLSDA